MAIASLPTGLVLELPRPGSAEPQIESAVSALGGRVRELALADRGPGPLALALLYGVYAIPWWGMAGTSPGKWLLGLGLVRADGRRPGLGRAVLRYLILLLLAPATWLTSLVRPDRAAVHDLIAGTRLVQMQEAGARQVIRGAIRRGVTDYRWAVAAVAFLLLGVGLVAVGAVSWQSIRPVREETPPPVDAVTQEALKGAILEYDRMEEHALYRLEASLLRPRATQQWVAKKREEFAEIRRSGRLQDSRLLEARFKGFRWAGEDRAEVDLVEVWRTVIFDRQGRIIDEVTPHEVPQTAVLVRDEGMWKVTDVRLYQAGNVPF